MSVICCGASASSGCGHIAGMLDRDLRTTRTKSRVKPYEDDQSYCHSYALLHQQRLCSNGNNNCGDSSAPVGGGDSGPRRRDSLLAAITHNLFPRRKAHGRRRIYTQKIYYLWKSLQKLSQFLTITLYLLALAPGALSAPTNRRNMASSSGAQDRATLPPKWQNPCGVNMEDFNTQNGGGSDNGDELAATPNKELLERIVYQTDITSRKAQDFKEEFAMKTFNQNADQVSVNNNVFEWLPTKEQIPKELGTFVSMDHLTTLSLDDTLLNTYEYLQKIAVGLEQILWDQQDYHGDFVQQFKDSENHLRLLLCEIQTAMIERGVRMRPDVQRDLMPRDHRTADKTFRKLRDWIIYREYMNALEYVKQVFEHLRQLQ